MYRFAIAPTTLLIAALVLGVTAKPISILGLGK
jgi:hypothetical protein